MRRLFFCLALLTLVILSGISYNKHRIAPSALQPAVEVFSTGVDGHVGTIGASHVAIGTIGKTRNTGSTGTTVSTHTSDANYVIRQISDGLYSYHGVDTRRGPQCVELAERFYVTNYPGTFPYHNSGPGAYDIWDCVANGKDVGGWAHYRRYFAAYANGTTAPQADDMLLYDRTRGYGWGHIAIIAEVLPDAIVILEQNNLWDTRRVLPLIGHQIIDRGVKGVVRLKKLNHAQTSR